MKKVHKGWIVINTITKSHSHFKSKFGCKCIITFLRKDIEPDDEYLKESYRRLTEGGKRRKKDKYYNKPKHFKVGG